MGANSICNLCLVVVCFLALPFIYRTWVDGKRWRAVAYAVELLFVVLLYAFVTAIILLGRRYS